MLLLKDPHYSQLVTYLQGTALLDTDLRQARAESALDVFVLTSKSVRAEQSVRTERRSE